MRKKMVAGNWKMNKTLQEGVQLGNEIKEALKGKTPHCEVVIATPFIHLATMAELMKDSIVSVSAENCADKEKGAYTGTPKRHRKGSTRRFGLQPYGR